MKEIHAYLNEDGTYRINGITMVFDSGKFMEAEVKMDRAKISITSMSNAEKECMSITVPDTKEDPEEQWERYYLNV